MSETSTSLIEGIMEAVAGRNMVSAEGLVCEALDSGLPPGDIRAAITGGLDAVRKNVMSNRVSLPEFLLSIDAATKALSRLAESDGRGDGRELTVVIGVVPGDPHDLGKSIISGVYRACGYRVVDLGAQVSREEFERAVVENRADILALSAMMSTTMGSMPEIIKTVRIVSPGTVVMVGGAPLDRKLAELYGADGYAESAVTVLEETEAALGKRTGAAQVHVSQGVHP